MGVFVVACVSVLAAGVLPAVAQSSASGGAGNEHADVVAPFQNTSAVSGGGGGTWTVTGLLNIFIWIVQWFYTILFIVAVLIFLLAAYNFILGGSNEDRVKTAKNQLKYGVIAIIVALLSMGVAYAIDTFLRTGM